MSRTKGPGESALLLLDVISVLDRHRIPYAVVGAVAASFYGIVRASADADAVISLPSGGPDLPTLVRELRTVGLKTTRRRGDLDDPIQEVATVEDRFGNRVDLLIGIRRMPEALFSRTVKAEFMGAQLRFVGLEDFIAMKLFAGGPQDLADAADALNVSARRIDKDLLKRVAQGYGREVQRRLESLLKGPAR